MLTLLLVMCLSSATRREDKGASAPIPFTLEVTVYDDDKFPLHGRSVRRQKVGGCRPHNAPASFSPSIEEGQTLDAYAGEAMEEYAVRGSNVEVNIAEAVRLVTDNDSASYVIRA